MTFLYSYFNKKIGSYMDPFPSAIPSDGMTKSVIRTCKLQPEEAKKAHLHECDFYFVGVFDDETGSVKCPEKPEFLVSLAPLFEEDIKHE